LRTFLERSSLLSTSFLCRSNASSTAIAFQICVPNRYELGKRLRQIQSRVESSKTLPTPEQRAALAHAQVKRRDWHFTRLSFCNSLHCRQIQKPKKKRTMSNNTETEVAKLSTDNRSRWARVWGTCQIDSIIYVHATQLRHLFTEKYVHFSKKEMAELETNTMRVRDLSSISIVYYFGVVA
jgi:hypothetical protein